MIIKVYTRKTSEKDYPAGLANSVHFALVDDKDPSRIIRLNNDYGILFAEGKISGENTIIPMGVAAPSIIISDKGEIVIFAKRIYEDGSEVTEDLGQVWCWKTKDLMHFETIGLADRAQFDRYSPKDRIRTDELFSADRIIEYWNPSAPDGEILPDYKFPLLKGYGDPVIFSWEGKRYFVSTYDNLHDVGIYVREADTVAGLFKEGTKEHLILPYDPSRNLIQTFWAPEFHVIGGELYILFAVSGKQWGPQCHLMKLKKGGSIIDPDSWGNPVRVVRNDGSFLAGDGAITLDMTYFKTNTGSYVVWSYREYMGTPRDTGSMLFIATIDENKPWQLTCEPMLLSRPLYGWENVEGTINNEGGYAFFKDDEIFLTYSGGAANSYTYAVGLFRAGLNADLMDLSSWKKSITPVLSFYSVDELGPGHNSFFEDEEGRLMIAYHGEMSMDSNLRCDAIRRVFFKEDGTPYFK
ncbi:MAG: family 43 glycosylhydrolase [Lachnospiraceae bacterium]|nr:family 43 glycosylhydrolase [Lachnospiraceae bacterium]